VLLLLRSLAAVVYRSAVLKALQRGTLAPADLHPVLAGLAGPPGNPGLCPVAAPAGLGWLARLTGRWAYRRVLFSALFVVWLGFVMHIYVGYFFVGTNFSVS